MARIKTHPSTSDSWDSPILSPDPTLVDIESRQCHTTPWISVHNDIIERLRMSIQCQIQEADWTFPHCDSCFAQQCHDTRKDGRRCACVTSSLGAVEDYDGDIGAYYQHIRVSMTVAAIAVNKRGVQWGVFSKVVVVGSGLVGGRVKTFEKLLQNSSRVYC